MSRYYVNDNAQASGDHEVHQDGCSWLSLVVSKTYLGDFSSCSGAVAEAKKKYPQSDGCAYCSPLCNHG